MQVDGWASAFGAVPRRLFAAANAVGGEMMGDRRRVERLHAQAKMIEIGAARARRARRRSRLVRRNDVDQRAPGAQLRQRALAFFERAAQHIHVEALERGRIGGAQHHMVDAEDGKGRSHGGLLLGGKLRPLHAPQPHRAAAWIRAYYTLPTLLQRLSLKGVYACLRGLTRIMHYAALFCTSGELTRADVPSGEIGVRQLVMQRVRG